MAISISFFLVYSRAKIQAESLQNKPVSIRCQVRYTRSHLNWSGAKRMGHDIIRLQFTTPAKAMPRLWANGKVKHTHPNALQINAIIDGIAERAVSLHAQYIAAGAFPPDNDYIAAILGTDVAAGPSSTLLQDYARYIGYLVDRKVTVTFLRQHKNLLGIMEQFQAQTGYLLEYETLNKTFAAKFAAWCQKSLPKRRKTQNFEKTAQRYFKDLRIFLNHAFTEGWTRETIWRQIKPRFKRNPFPTTLTEDEIARLLALTAADIPCRPRQQKTVIITRDWFLFGTQTCMRWSDWQGSKYRFVDLSPIGWNLQFVQKKTGDALEIPLSALALEILRKYDFRMPPCYSPYSTIQHLALLARAAGIEKHLTSHTARRTYCTLAEKAGVPRGVVMRISGHQTEKDYLLYTGISFEYNADMMRRANPAMFAIKKSG